ncbi:MAG: hypothetical protein LH617_01485 [Ramlibacter sp.]|nr:hypothetical protein [Ramlibacter sp.]
MTDRKADGDPVLAEFDACVATMKAMNEEIMALRLALERAYQTIAAFREIGPLQPMTQTTSNKRGRGRPRKVIDDSWMLEWFDLTKAQFMDANKFKRPTDGAVITWAFKQLFLQYGGRASKADSPAFQAKLKRFKNRLGDVRNPVAKTPIK